MKIALAIKSCHRYADRRQSQLDTWLKTVDTDFFFLLGDAPTEYNWNGVTDALYCRARGSFAPVSDAFADIAPKVLHAVEYALADNVTNLVVCDDDTFIHWPRMMESGFERFDYLGFVRSYSDTPYMQGSCYTLSERAMAAIVKRNWYMKNGVPDDAAVGQCLYGEVPFTHENRFSIGVPYPMLQQMPLPNNSIVASHKMNVPSMKMCHRLWTEQGS